MIDLTAFKRDFPGTGIDISRWEQIVNLMAESYESANASIVHFRNNEFCAVATSTNDDNFLNKNDTWPWDMHSFCRRIIETNAGLYVNDAINDEEWVNNLSVCEGPVRSYYGLPIHWPDDSLFGTICLIDTKATDYPSTLYRLLEHFRDIVEYELKLSVSHEEVCELAGSLQQQNRSFLSLLSALPVPYAIFNQQGALTHHNTSFGERFANMSCNDIREVFVEADDHRLITAVNSDDNRVLDRECKLKNGDEEQFWAVCSAVPVTFENEHGVLFTIRDISDHKHREQQLQEEASLDPLTGALNRREFMRQAEASKAQGCGSCVVAMFDLDNFKQLNDSYGHAAGDEVLVVFADAIRNQLRDTDIFARIGGEEFALVLSNVRLDTANQILQRLCESVRSQAVDYQGFEIRFTMSGGVCSWQGGTSLQQALDEADKLLYQAKSEGRDRIISA